MHLHGGGQIRACALCRSQRRIGSLCVRKVDSDGLEMNGATSVPLLKRKAIRLVVVLPFCRLHRTETALNRIVQNRLLLQLLFTFVAMLSVAALSVVLISGAIQSAERVVLAEARNAVVLAVSELKQQYQNGASSDVTWRSLPLSARDVSLQGISQTVLRAYQGVEGGFYVDAAFAGYTFPTHDTGSVKTDVPSAERGLILSLVQQAVQEHRMTEQVIRGKTDLLVMGASASQDGSAVIWAMKRIAGRATPDTRRREFMLAILVGLALISTAGTLATGISLARGVAEIKGGLATLEKDFNFRLAERSDELGGISRSINRMANVRGKLEAELRREDQLRAIGRLAAGLAHEIRNPLNSIRLTVQLLERRSEANSIRSADLRTVRNEVDRLSLLLNDLLDLQRSRQARPEILAVVPVVERCITLIEPQAEMQNTRVYLEAAAEAVFALFDSQQLTQTIMNLLLNALEASSEGGTVTVRVFKKSEIAMIEVQDEGPGMDAEQQAHLFEPFYTTKPSGTGLGLAVSRELLRGQGGDLQFKLSPAGACFVVELPGK